MYSGPHTPEPSNGSLLHKQEPAEGVKERGLLPDSHTEKTNRMNETPNWTHKQLSACHRQTQAFRVYIPAPTHRLDRTDLKGRTKLYTITKTVT